MAVKRSSSSDKKGAAAKKTKLDKKGDQLKRFPIRKIHELLQIKFPTGQVKPEAAVYLTAILEYLAVEMLERAANVARSRHQMEKKGTLKLNLNDVLEAIQSDEEMKELIDRCRLGDLHKKL